MNILLSTFCLTRINGTYFRAYYLARELAKRSHKVTLASISPTSRFKATERSESGIRLIEFPNLLHRLIFHFGNGPLDITQRTRLILNEDYDVVHGFEYYANVMIPILLTKWLKKYVYVSDWCDWFSKGMAMNGRRFTWFKPGIKVMSTLEEQTRLKAHGVTVISQELEQKVISLGISQDKILRLPGGAPTDLIKPMPKKEAREQLGYPIDAGIALFLGISHDDLDIFIRAFSIVVKERPNSLLLLVGYNQPLRVWELVHAMGLDKNVIRVGGIPSEALGRYLACADLFLLPLRDNDANRSRWPNKIGDYMAAGRPIIASRVGEVVPVMESDNIGFLVANDPQEVAKHMMKLFDNPEVAEDMGSRARALAENKYSWEQHASRLETFYLRFLS